MDNSVRMKILVSITIALVLCQCAFLPSGKSDEVSSSGGQVDWVLDAIDKRHSNGKVVIVDKRAATVSGYKNSRRVFSYPALLGRNRKDDFNKSISAFSQGVTPATYYKIPQIMYNPKFPGMYKEKAVIAFGDLTKVGEKTEVLSFHTTLSGSNDSNASDGNAGNNRISNGCIRVRYSDYMKLVAFMLPGGDLDKLRDAQKKGSPVNISSIAAVVVMPELGRSQKETLKTLGLD